MKKWSPTSPEWFPEESWELHQSAANLTRYACIVSSRHIRDVAVRARFNRAMVYSVRQVLEEVRSAKISVEEGLKKIEEEHKGLTKIQTIEALIGLRAGMYQFVDGVKVCRSVVSCTYGLPAIIHGANNVYENGGKLWTDDADFAGPVRKLYRNAAEGLGKRAVDGDIAYGSVDIFLSGYALLRKVPKKGSWMLFRRSPTDLERAYMQMGEVSLVGDISATILTIKNLLKDVDE